MNKKIYITVIITFMIALIAFLFFLFFEIYDYKDYIYPTREISRNSFYAMEQWLKETGHSVRSENSLYSSDFLDITEKIIIANSSVLDFIYKDRIIEWIKNGNYLVLHLDRYSSTSDEYMIAFLSDLGITFDYIQPSTSPNEEINNDEKTYEDFPDLQTRIEFYINTDYEFYSLTDNFDSIKLVEIKIGEGAFTVTGTPLFMHNNYLDKEKNANFSWRLTGARDDGQGVLFVSPQGWQPSESFLEIIKSKGNLLPVIVSALLLIITGFWMVIPQFGLVFEEKQRVLRPISDRFSAEIKFLKKTNSLDYYLKFYDLENKSEEEKKYNYRNLINQYRRLNDGRKKI